LLAGLAEQSRIAAQSRSALPSSSGGRAMAKAIRHRRLVGMKSTGPFLLLRRRSLLELDPAILHHGCLFKRLHLTFEAGEFGGSVSIATHEKRGRPEDNDCCGCRDLIIGPLLVLRASHLGRVRGHVL
jgi:hypothetical protein